MSEYAAQPLSGFLCCSYAVGMAVLLLLWRNVEVRVDVQTETPESVNELIVVKTEGESTLRPHERNINLYATVIWLRSCLRKTARQV